MTRRKLGTVTALVIAAGFVAHARLQASDNARIAAWSIVPNPHWTVPDSDAGMQFPSSWYDSAIHMQFASEDYDSRIERQQFSCDLPDRCPPVADRISRAKQFADRHRGYLYRLGDEMDLHGVTPEAYAEWFHDFVTEVRSVDPTARFSTGGITDVPSVGSELHFLDYANAIRSHYVATFGVEPPVAEWRFAIDGNPVASMDIAAAWAAAQSLPVSFSYWPDADHVAADLPAVIAKVNSDSRIAHLDYWVWKNPEDGPGRVLYVNPCPPNQPPCGALTPHGQTFRTASLTAPSIAGESVSPVGDFDKDGFADYADHLSSTGNSYVHRHKGAPDPINTFHSGSWAEWLTAAGAEWDWIVADFTGDGYADYADVHPASRQVWVHENRRNGTFEATALGPVSLANGFSDGAASDVEILAADVNGDGKADLLKRELSTGLIWVYKNKSSCPVPPASEPCTLAQFLIHGAPGQAKGRTKTGPDWRAIVADFTGDGLADYADQHIPSGLFWIHRNTGVNPGGAVESTPDYAMEWRDWAVVQATGGTGWKTMVGKFTNYDALDNRLVDYADVHIPSGTFWIHRNYGNGVFDPPGTSWGVGLFSTLPWAILGGW